MRGKKQEALIDRKEFYSNLTRLALPIALQSLMLASVAAGDALMLGKVAQNEMTAVSLATQIQFVQNMFIMAVTGAGAILGAQYWGKGDRHTLEDIFNIMLRFSGIVSLIFFLGCELVPGLLMHIFTHDEALIVIGSSYLRIAGWSYLFTGVSQCYLTIMKVSDHVKPGALISSCAVLLNICLNAVFIFGLFGVPGMQARGAALATTISRIIELALCIAVSKKESYICPAFDRFMRVPGQLKSDFIRQCLPLMGGSLCWGVGFTSYTAIMGHVGTDAAAANSVAAVVRDLICCMCNGIGSAAGIIVGNELGAGRLDMGRAYGIKLKNLSYVIGFISTALVLAVTPLVVRMVILTDQARGYLTGMMVIMSVYMIGRCVNTVTINGVLDGGGDTLFDMYSLIVCMWLIAIPLALIGAFVLHWSPLAVYACTCLDEVGKIPWVMIRFRKYKWVQDLTR
ncbi:MATE family efflux transporter [Parablautia intestinalis]|uniref:MATE family efflux transporter n=2 Tax=Parablautia intestinalis TaxID=2320100 RepID=A0A3A9AE94_9FIRM|nr:MATE family efflux transporter [Lachnospiraceae bacterium]RKI89717.1 MATE family efflux transporter [Parablautia intestinalis]